MRHVDVVRLPVDRVRRHVEVARHAVDVEHRLEDAALAAVERRLHRVLDEADVVPAQVVLNV